MINLLSHNNGTVCRFYQKQTEELEKIGYSRKESLWINFACSVFRFQQNVVISEHILNFYLSKYRESDTDDRDIYQKLKEKFEFLKGISLAPENSKTATKIGRNLLPESENILKQIHAGFMILKEIRKRFKSKASTCSDPILCTTCN